jgi:hypothetical protein
VEVDPTRMCELLVGLPAINVLGIADDRADAVVVLIESRGDQPGCPGCGTAAPAVDPQVELAAVRIAQEGVTNALRHAEARRAVVRVAQEAGHLVVAVDDDGLRGKAPALSADGHGLRGMAEGAVGLRRTARHSPQRPGRLVGAGHPALPEWPAVSAEGATTIRVLVADDRAMIRVGLRQILDNEPDLAVVAEAADGLGATFTVRLPARD